MELKPFILNSVKNVSTPSFGLADLTKEQIQEKLGLDFVIKLSFNENPLGPSPKAIEAMSNSLSSLHLYTDPNGSKLRNKIAEREGLNEDNIILSNGADEMISLIAQTFLKKDDEVIIPELTFSTYQTVSEFMQATVTKIPMKKDLDIDLKNMKEAITPKTKIIFLCNPNNPTGKPLSKEKLDNFYKDIPGNVLVVVDEAYHEYAEEPEYYSSLPYIKQGKNIIVIRTFSKIYSLAAGRLGYGIAAKPIIDAINRIRLPFNVNGVVQAGAIASLEDVEHVEKVKDINNAGKKLLYQTFNNLGLSFLPSSTNFVLVETGVESNLVVNELATQGIIVRNLAGQGLPTSIRVSIGNEQEINAFSKALTKIIKQIKE